LASFIFYFTKAKYEKGANDHESTNILIIVQFIILLI